MRIRVAVFAVIAVIALLAALTWTSDAISLQGERTVYTVECRQGSWRDGACNGQLVAGDRYRFRALKAHHEVIFWISGSSEPSGKLSDCQIADGRNWICKPDAEAPRTITLQMSHGRPVPDRTGTTKPFHDLSKWRWYLLRSGYAF